MPNHPRRHIVNRKKGGGGWVDGGHFLENQRRVQARQCKSVDVGRSVKPAEAEFSGLCDSLAGEDAFRVPLRSMGAELVARKLACGTSKGMLFFSKLEIHGVMQLP